VISIAINTDTIYAVGIDNKVVKQALESMTTVSPWVAASAGDVFDIAVLDQCIPVAIADVRADDAKATCHEEVVIVFNEDFHVNEEHANLKEEPPRTRELALLMEENRTSGMPQILDDLQSTTKSIATSRENSGGFVPDEFGGNLVKDQFNLDDVGETASGTGSRSGVGAGQSSSGSDQQLADEFYENISHYNLDELDEYCNKDSVLPPPDEPEHAAAEITAYYNLDDLVLETFGEIQYTGEYNLDDLPEVEFADGTNDRDDCDLDALIDDMAHTRERGEQQCIGNSGPQNMLPADAEHDTPLWQPIDQQDEDAQPIASQEQELEGEISSSISEGPLVLPTPQSSTPDHRQFMV
jgi:hypothetical protein